MKRVFTRLSYSLRLLSVLGMALTPVHGYADDDEVNYTDQIVIESCVQPAQNLFNQCDNQFKAQAGEMVAASGGAITGDVSLSSMNSVEALRNSSTQLARDLEAMRNSVCSEMVEECVQNCRQGWEQAQQTYSTPEQQPRLETARQQFETGIQRECGDIVASAREAALNNAQLGGLQGEQALTENALTGDGAGAAGGGLGKWGAAALGAAAAVGAMCLFGSACGDDDEDLDDEDGGDTIEPDTPIDCTVDGSYTNPDCQAEFITHCSADQEAAGCQEFIDQYCSSENTEGLGTAFCEQATQVAFCDEEANSDCLSCVQASNTNTAACAEDPTQCILTDISQDQMAGYQSACPTDPIFSSSEYIQWQLDNDGTNGDGGSSNDPYVVTPQPGEEVDTLVELTEENRTNPDYSQTIQNRGGVSVVFSVMPAGVGASDGASLFDSNSSAIVEQCDLGLLANCGPAN
ncbi:MAG: hypothetical protein HRT45_04845 [Bdellovibrionales bacterium]|nr:hypothetical protein [Bdellovibrionales bacterium]